MAPQQSRKRKSDEMDSLPQAVTPSTSPARKKMKMTQTQKQALIDNLQLEITERARGLRAHYALQCADLRSRIERRVNRVPMSLRNMTMGELMAKHEPVPKPEAREAAAPTRTSTTKLPPRARPQEKPVADTVHDQTIKSPSSARLQIRSPAATRTKKRKSSGIIIASDQENEVDQAAMDTLPVNKNNKRAKANPGPARAISRSQKANAVLSPRSNNSRTLPRSPIKDHPLAPPSPVKSLIARPVSPLKPISPFKSAASAATSAISASVHGMIEHAKRGTTGKLSRTSSREKTETKTSTRTATGKMLPPPRPMPSAPQSPMRTASQASNHSTASDVSSTSTSTTVVTKPKRGGRTTSKAATASEDRDAAVANKVKGAATKAASAAKGALKKTAGTTNKKVVVAEPASGRRVLRKRN